MEQSCSIEITTIAPCAPQNAFGSNACEQVANVRDLFNLCTGVTHVY